VPSVAGHRRVADLRNIPRLETMPHRIDVHDSTHRFAKKLARKISELYPRGQTPRCCNAKIKQPLYAG
jgi:hypothetical protein